MKLQIKNFNFSIDFSNKINLIIIENKGQYRKINNSILNKLDSTECEIIITDDNKVVTPSKKIFVFHDYYSFDINKHFLTKFYKLIKDRTLLENSNELSEIKSNIENFIYKIIEPYDLFLEMGDELDLTEILKSVHLKIKNYGENIMDEIINSMNLINEITGIDTFIFLNLKNNFYEKEIIDFYKYVNYNNFNIVVIESSNYNRIGDFESTILIDEDLCEIY